MKTHLRNPITPLFPALRSDPTAVSGATRQKQIPSSKRFLLATPLPVVGLLAATLTCGPVAGQEQEQAIKEPTALPSGLLFEDDFSSGDFSKHNDYFRWGRSGNIPKPTGDAGKIEQVEGPDGEPVKAMRFGYKGKNSPDGPAYWQEIRFHLTESVEEQRTESSESDVAHREVWVRYSMLIPENYHHNMKNGTAAGSNQKGWIFLWNRNYSKKDGPDDRSAPVSQHWEWWPTRDGQSVATYIIRKGAGHAGATWAREDHRVEGQSRALTWLKSDHGKWVDFAFSVRASSGPDAEDALMQVYKNGELVQEKADFVSYPRYAEDHHLAGFDRGYILGYHNAAYTEDTTYYITDFKIGTTGEGVGITPARPEER